jgi:hypothetical protein
MDKSNAEFSQEMLDDMLMVQPQIDDVTLKNIAEIRKFIDTYEPLVKQKKEEEKEWTAHLHDDPYFVSNNKAKFSQYNIEIGITRPTEMDDKYFKDKLIKNEQEKQKILDEWDNVRHGECKTKSAARVFVKSIKIK